MKDHTNLVALPYGIGSAILPGLTKVNEECFELGQVISKIQAMGFIGRYWDGTDLSKLLLEEVGDVEATLEYIKHHLNLDRGKIKARKKDKLKKYARWHKNVRSGKAPNAKDPPKKKKKT